MPIKTIPLSRLEVKLHATLRECADSGDALVVELPDKRLIAIQPLDPAASGDSLIDDLLQSNSEFRSLIKSSKASAHKPYVPAPSE